MKLNLKQTCYCNKPVTIVSDLKRNVVVRKCPVSKKAFLDIKFVKTISGNGFSGIELVESEKEGVPCSYYDEIKIEVKKRSWVQKWKVFCEGVVSCALERSVLQQLTTSPEEDFKRTIQMLIQKVETRNSFNPMNWETIDKLNFYAIQHLLIEPWNMSGPNKETFEEFFERFKKQPVIDKSYILYKKKYFEFVEKKRNKARVREKSIASLSIFPRLQSHARKSLKKAEKKKRQEMNKFAVNLQTEQFEKIYYNIKKSDTKYESCEGVDDIEYIDDATNDFAFENESEDTGSVSSSIKDNEEDEEEEEEEELDEDEEEYEEEFNVDW